MNSRCEVCRLYKQCKTHFVKSRGNLENPNIIILGEAPGCVSGDTLIEVAFRDVSKYPKGIPIRELVGKKDFYVYSYDIENDRLVLGKVKKVWKTGTKMTYKVTYRWKAPTQDGDVKWFEDSIIVTSNHKFLLKKAKPKDPFKGINSNVEYEYLSIDEGLTIGHSVMPFYRHFYKKGDKQYTFIGASHNTIQPEHKFLMEFLTGKDLGGREYNVHHKDGNGLNNTLENLEVLTVAEHARIHKLEFNPMYDPVIREKHRQVLSSKEYRENMSRVMKEKLKTDKELYERRVKQLLEAGKKTRFKKGELDPVNYYKRLLSYVRKGKRTLEWVEERFKSKFPDLPFPPIDNHIIVSIEPYGVIDVYDMKVEKYHNFVANGVIIHNSTEDKQGKPFVGKSGKLLEEVFRLFNKELEEVCYITNVVKCCPYADPFNPNKGVRPPTDKEIECCLPYLIEELERFKGKDVVIMPLGNTALKGLGIKGKISELAGKELEWNGYKVIPNFHPASILRNPKWKQKFISVFGKVLDNRQVEWESLIRVLVNREAVNLLQSKLEENPEWFCFDIETTGFDPFKDDVIMLTFSFPNDPYGYVIPLYNKDPLPGDKYEKLEVLPNPSYSTKILKLTKELLEKIPVIGHNIKFDLKFMVTKTGLDLSKVKVKDDTLFLAHFVFNKAQLGESLSLKDVAVKVLGLDGKWDEEVKEYLKSRYRLRKDRHYGNVPTSLLCKYAGFDILFTKEIYLVLSERVKVFNCDEIREALNKATILFAEAELKGTKVDNQIREFLDYKYTSEIKKAEKELQELSKIKEWKQANKVAWFNPTSQIHQKEVAFKVYQLPVVQTTDKGQPSLGKKAISWYLDNLPESSEERKFVELLYRIKLFKKLKSTYIDGFAGELDENGYYHTTFNIAGTITGRMSSPYHTIPSKSDIKRMFVSRWYNQGGLIISADYSQLEVRVAASLSNETKLIEAYKQGIDVHKRTASMIFNKPMEEITKQERKIAKTVVFGILYGKTAKSLAEDFNISLEEAQQWMDNLFGGYSNLRKWIENQHRFVLANGFVITAFNRVIPVPMAFESDKWKKEEAKRKAVNYPVQSSASDLTTTSVVRLWENMKRLGLKSVVLGTIHDAIVIDVAPGELITVYNLIVKNAEVIPMKIYDWLTCPIRIDVSIGSSWGGCIEWDRIEVRPDYLELEGTGFYRDLESFRRLVEKNYNIEAEKIGEEEFDEPAPDQFIYSPKKEVWKVKIWKSYIYNGK